MYATSLHTTNNGIFKTILITEIIEKCRFLSSDFFFPFSASHIAFLMAFPALGEILPNLSD